MMRSAYFQMIKPNLFNSQIHAKLISVTMPMSNNCKKCFHNSAYPRAIGPQTFSSPSSSPHSSMSTESIDMITKKEQVDGSKVERINIVRTWNNMSKSSKRGLAIYGALSVGTFAYGIYQDGCHGLEKYRNGDWPYDSKDNPEQTKKKEFEAIVNGCKRDAGGRFADALIFPYTIFKSIVPHAVYYMNKNNDKKN
jgi:hypothetical protein